MLLISTFLSLSISLVNFSLVNPANAGTVTVTALAPSSTSKEYSDASDFQKAILNSTNTYRAQHNASALSWNTSLADFAENWGKACVFQHSGGPSGENLASGYPNATASIEAWGNERDHYDFSAGKFSETTGHFTQLVWKSTTTVGCSRTNCAGKKDDGDKKAAPGWFVVCEYYPPGNVIGSFKQNVQKRVKESGKGDCPQGGACGGAGRLGAGWGWERLLWVGGLGAVVGWVL